MKNLVVPCGIALLFAVMSSCKNPAGPPSDPATKGYISYSLNNGAQTVYSKGVSSGSSNITLTVLNTPFASIPNPFDSSTSNLYLYASNNNATFENPSTDFIYIYFLAGGTTILSGDHNGANLNLNVGGIVNTATVDLITNQTFTSSSDGMTITGTFSGTLSDGTTPISGSFSLVYQTTTLVIP